jgi:hypothetical protein
MGLSSIFRRDTADAARNGNAAHRVEDKADLASRFLEHVMSAWDLLEEARRRREEEKPEPKNGRIL